MYADITQDPDFPDDPGCPPCRLYGKDPCNEAILRRRTEENPDDWRPWLRLGLLLFEQRDAADTIPVLKRAVSLAPGNGITHYLLGFSRWEHRQNAKAEREFETAVRLRPDLADAWDCLAFLRYDRGRIAESLEAWLAAARLAPDTDAFANLGRCFLKLRRTPEAIVAYEEALEWDHRNVEPHLALARIGHRTGDAEMKRQHVAAVFAMDLKLGLKLEGEFEREPRR